LYLFLILVSDKSGISFYSFDSICNLLGLNLSEYLEARDELIGKDLICFKDNIFQVLSLPDQPARTNVSSEDPARVRHMIIQSLKEASND